MNPRSKNRELPGCPNYSMHKIHKGQNKQVRSKSYDQIPAIQIYFSEYFLYGTYFAYII